jgi:hypothetical protein
MEQSVGSKRTLPTFIINSQKIILNYGVEIEAVFELINENIAYNQFINYYIHNKRASIETITKFINLIITCINNPPEAIEEIQGYIDKLKSNIIFNNLGRDESTFYNVPESENDRLSKEQYIEDRLNELIDLDTNKPLKKSTSRMSSVNNNIQNWSEFVNIGIIIIKYMLDKNKSGYNIQDVINVLNIPVEIQKNVFTAFTNIFDLTENKKIKLYNIIENIDEFYEQIQNDDEICLCLTEDSSVICDNMKVYTNISSGKIVKSYKLLNNCEFITKPFKSINDINKLSIFFDDPIIKNTLLNCEKTSQHVHISFNKNKKIIKPDIYLVLCIVCVCYHFQDEIFKLFLITRTDNIYCKKLNYNFTGDDVSDFDIKINDYNTNLKKINNLFYKKYNNANFHRNNRYYWLNIINLYNHGDDDKPYTIEFRLKHGSIDIIELINVCKLYENIINYATELLKNNPTLEKQKNMTDFKILIEYIMNDNKDNIFNEKILNNIKDYFTDNTSSYFIGLNKLNNELKKDTAPMEVLGGKKSIIHDKKTILNRFISSLENTPIYKKNSFGNEYIGDGLDDYIIDKFKDTDTINIHNIQTYLNSNNIFYQIYNKDQQTRIKSTSPNSSKRSKRSKY